MGDIFPASGSFCALYCDKQRKDLNLNAVHGLSQSKKMSGKFPNLTFTMVAFATVVCSFDFFCHGQDRIILRNLRMIKTPSIQSFDVDGVVIQTGETITWDRIEQIQSKSQEQAKLDEFHGRLSDPLFRVRMRLLNGDDLEALPLAEKMLPVFRSSESELGALVFAALIRGRIQSGQRAAAVVPLLYYMKLAAANVAEKLPSAIQLSIDQQSKVCNSLLPVWFDPDAAKQQLPFLLESLKTVRGYPREFHVYTGSLAIAAGDKESAEKALSALGDQGTQGELKEILYAQSELAQGNKESAIARLRKFTESDTTPIRILALYWTGVAKSRGSNRERMQGALTLMKIVAAYGDQFPDMSAAALYQAGKAVDFGEKDSQSESLRREIQRAFPDSWHGRLLAEKKQN